MSHRKKKKPEAQENNGGKYEFEKFLEGMRLRPISFISKSAVSPLENSGHRFVREVATVRRAIGKFRNYLWGSKFTVLSDYSGLKIFFESEANVPHVVHMW